MIKSDSPKGDTISAEEDQIIARKFPKGSKFGVREFDIILYSLGVVPYSIIREFESLPLRIAVSLRNSTEPDHSGCISTSQPLPAHCFQGKPLGDEKADLPTMLQTIECPLSQIQNITSKASLMINLSADSLVTVKTIIEACIATSTNYADCCTNIEVIKQIFACYGQDTSIKVIQGCAHIPFLIDLGVFSLGKIHEVKEVEATVVCSRECSTFGHAILAYESNTFNSLRYNYETQAYEILLHDPTDFILTKSRHYFRKKGISHARSSAYVSIRYIFVFLIYFFIVSMFSHFTITKKYISLYKKARAGVGSNVSSSIAKIIFSGNATKHDKHVKMTITASKQKNDISAICLSQLAATLIEDTVISETGVLTPAIALHETRIIERLAYKHIKFQYFYSE